ncbi:MAG: Re/Si-specific NAD(P)(+) transhydrogenase subunit alpha [Bdellovibrionales bacterium]
MSITVGIPQEHSPETRVAISSGAIKKLVKMGCLVRVEKGAGQQAGFTDEILKADGAELTSRQNIFQSDVIFQIHPPQKDDVSLLKKSSILLSHLRPHQSPELLKSLAQAQVSAFSVEMIPRTSRAQSMDVLSSQANIAGYRAVLEATQYYPRFLPMMMTSAGLAKQAKVLVLGAGVAGLQAIATAKRLGGSVEAFDLRPEVKEQIQSLGAKFLDLGTQSEGVAGYAKELSEEAKKQQQQALTEKIKKFDVVITTANVPGRKSPVLVSEEAVKGMRHGSVIVDLAAANGGNCALTEEEKVVVKFGVTIIGKTNYPGLVPYDASLFYSQNLVSLLALMIDEKGKKIKINFEDDILAAACMTHAGTVRFQGGA